MGVPSFVNGLAYTLGVSFAFDAGAGNNRILIVAAFFNNNAGGDPGITGTYAGVALGKFIFKARVNGWHLAAFSLANPASGSNTLALANGGNASAYVILAACYQYVDVGDPISAPISGAVSASIGAPIAVSNNITSAFNESLDIEMLTNDGAAIAATAGQTVRVQTDTGALFRLSEKKGTGGVDTLTWNKDFNMQGAWVGFSLNPAPEMGAPVGVTPFLTH